MKHFYAGLVCCLLTICSFSLNAQSPTSSDPRRCQDDGRISVAFSGATAISTCTDDDVMDRIRFQVLPFRQAFAYVVVDANDIIQYLDFSNFINFDLLPAGPLRVYAFSTYGRITASVGDNFSTATLSTPCAGLTTNFVSVNNGQIGDLQVISDQTEYDLCVGDGDGDVINVSSDAQDVIYLITDIDGNVLATNETGEIDFDGAGAGVCRVYALGGLTIEPGQNISILDGQGACGSGLSRAFITVNRTVVDGGSVATTTGETELRTCPSDGSADVFDFAVTGNDGDNQRFVVTNAANVIIGLPAAATVDFDGAGVGVCRLWSVTFSGAFTAEEGDVITTTDLSDGCYALSDNFVTVFREIPEGGSLATLDGAIEVRTCPGDGNPDIVSYASTGAGGGNIVYLISDADNNILATTTETSFDFENAGPGACRIWGLSYQGELTANVGDNAATATLSTDCFDVSDNFINVVRVIPEGGTISTDTGATEVSSCPGDGLADEFTFVSTGGVGANLAFVITNAEDEILNITTDATIDFDGAGFGTCRVWALNYEGNLTGTPQTALADAVLSDACFALSDNFVTVVRDVPVGGTITTDAGETEVLTCPGDGVDDLFNFTVSGATGPNSRLVVTNADNIVIGLPDGNSINFDEAGVGICRVWNLSFVGEFTGEIGDNAATAALASGCSQLSDNFVTVIRQVPEGGLITTNTGGTEVRTCPGDGNADVVAYTTLDATGGNIVYLITDADNNILTSTEASTFDFEGAGTGACRIWTLVYQGELTFAAGDNAATADLASSCFALSENFINVVRVVPEGGTVATTDGATELTTCPGDGLADAFTFVSEGAVGENFTFVVTDAENVILNVLDGNTADFEGAGTGACRVWGLSYEGNLTAVVGQDLAGTALSDACFALSTNFVTVIREQPTGGTIATVDGDTELQTCPGDGNDDIVTFSVAGNVGPASRLIITDASGMIIGLPPANVVNFEGAGTGTCVVYNVTFVGDFTAMEGDNINTDALATGCSALSDNSVTVVREVPAGGTVATADGATEVEFCPGDGNEDLVTAVSTGATGGAVAYLITDADNTVLNVSTDDNTFNFDEAGVGVCRIWVVSYQGELTVAAGDNAATADLSDGCFDLSDNFISVIRSVPTGGTVATDSGETEINICPGDNRPDPVQFVSTGAAEDANFTFVVTTDNNIVLAVTDGPTVDFEGAGVGVCRLWGLSYAGDLLVEEGTDLDNDGLASGCFSLSDNFVTVVRDLPSGGTLSLENGETVTSTCPGDGIADLVTVISEGATGDEFALIITDDSGIILGFPGSNTINFDDVAPGTCRIYGLAYSGDVIAQQGQDINAAELATSCAALSDNFVTVVREPASTGTISTEAGETEILVCPGDDIPDRVRFDSTGTTLNNFNYLIADTNGIVLSVAFTHEINFETFPQGVCRVYGLGYNGLIRASLGDIIGESALATECFAISENFVTVTKQTPEGGSITTQDGATEVVFCTMDGVADLVTVVTTSEAENNYAYIVSTTDNIILVIQDSPTFNFDLAAFGTCRIWGLSYQGDILAQPGDDAGTIQFSTGCFDLSGNFIFVQREDAEAGTVSLAAGGDTTVTCPGDGNADVVEVVATGTAGSSQLFAVTDANNSIISFFDGSFDFENAGIGVCRIWSIAFAGDLIATPGDNITTADLASGCFDLSENFVTVIREIPDGGSIALAEGTVDTAFCSGDPMMDSLVFVTDATTAASYGYLITQDSIVLQSFPGNGIDLSDALSGNYMVYGIAYTGELTVSVGLNIFENDLATGCFDLSDNAVDIMVTQVDGGTILGNGAENVYLCRENPDDGFVTFTRDVSIADAEFTYVIATASGVIFSVLDSSSFDFGSVPLEELRVYGISYTGDFLVNGSLPITAPLSTECYTLSDNFVTIFTDTPEAGEISFDNVSGSGVSCTVDGDGDISVSTTSTSLTGYAIIVTDTANIVQLVSTDPTSVPLGDLPEGDYRVWGLAYTGNVTVQAGDDLTVVALANNCYELTADFLEVRQGGSITAGTISSLGSPSDTLTFCLSGGDNPIAILESSVVGPNYRYIITDANGRIIAPNLPSNIIPFTVFGPGEYRIYGFNFTGTATVSINQSINGFLSTECFAVTSNFITVILEEPNGGEVTTTAGETEIALEIDEDGDAFASFMTTSDSLYNFAYVVTDEDNNILAIADTNALNFGPAGVGVCRVWGLAYTGEILAMQGDNAATTDLTDGCFDLSDNFVTVTRTERDNLVIPERVDKEIATRSFLLSVFPNPSAGSEINLTVKSLFPLPDGQVSVRDLNGRAYNVQTLVGGHNETTVRLDISSLPSGMYFAQFRTQLGLSSVRFMKR